MTSVLAINPGHDGAVAFVEDGELVFSFEAEKDSFPRNSEVTAAVIDDAMSAAPSMPDVVALGGWYKVLPGLPSSLAGGYGGLVPGEFLVGRFLGRRVVRYTSSHERSHIYGTVGMSSFDPQAELAVLVWEGVIGAFYWWRDGGRSLERHEVLDQPGSRYSALYAIADASFEDRAQFLPQHYAGRLMALVGHADDKPPSEDSKQVVATLLRMAALNPFDKARFRQSPLFDCGIPNDELCRSAKHLSHQLFATFRDAASTIFSRRIPLAISGGCGLNCDWNSAWEASGLFSEVFVPPCPNDAGSAIGTALDAWAQFVGPARLSWDVYRGAPFVSDIDPVSLGWVPQPRDPHGLAVTLDEGHIVAWVQGRTEIGPRALGHRSLLASAQRTGSRELLNQVKQREAYRPIAPVCLEDDLADWFDNPDPDPHMLRFRTVTRPSEIPAVVHADGTARAQSVTARSCPELHSLLLACRDLSGVGILCNTSLNFPGRGFINRTSELLHFCDRVGIQHAVVDDKWFSRSTTGPGAVQGDGVRTQQTLPSRGRQ